MAGDTRIAVRYIPLAVTLILGILDVGSASSNSELHPGGRLFFPLWDVSSPNRVTFILLTREALNDSQSIHAEITSTAGGAAMRQIWTASGTGRCRPRGVGGSANDVNRTDLGGTDGVPVFVDDVHFEYYGRSCNSANEVVHMSCGDIDLFLLAAPENPSRKPRMAFAHVAGEGRGAMDVHLISNGSGNPGARKLENSLMGHAIISDLAEGWAAVYPAATAGATSCPICGMIDGGTAVGYENYPMELYLPWAFADLLPAPGGTVRNILSVWAPGLFPGANLSDTSVGLDIRWWDGRERAFGGSAGGHAVIRPLGGPPMAGMDAPVAGLFSVAGFVCGHDASGSKAENDGFPRTGSEATACGPPQQADAAHPSDNVEAGGEPYETGHSIQGSRPIGWWRFRLRTDGDSPLGVGAHSGRGLVGVVLSVTPGAEFVGVGDATRLWHEDSCEGAQSDRTIGPPHLRDGGVWANSGGGFTPADLISVFNIFDVDDQTKICAGRFTDG